MGGMERAGREEGGVGGWVGSLEHPLATPRVRWEGWRVGGGWKGVSGVGREAKMVCQSDFEARGGVVHALRVLFQISINF